MERVVERVKLQNFLAPDKVLERDAVIDPSSIMMALPQNLINALGLRKIREDSVRNKNNRLEQKSVYAGLLLEIKGRAGTFDVIAEPEGTEPVVGEIVLTSLDLVVEPRTHTLIPNPRSPEMPMVEIL
jgi:predicted aspartyl protease